MVGATNVNVHLRGQWSHYCILEKDGEITEAGRFRTTEGGVAKRLEGVDHARVAMEAGMLTLELDRVRFSPISPAKGAS